MRFELRRTTATFGVFHPREEKNKGAAFDIPFEVTVGAEILPNLFPTHADDEANADEFIGEFFSVEGYVRRPAISPLKVHRKPEGVIVTIWDQEDFGPALVLKPCRLNKLEVTLQSPHQVVLTGQIQYSQYNDQELIRINALMNKKFDLSLVIEQVDMFEGGEGEGGESEEDEDEVSSESEAEQDYEDPEE